LVPEGGELELRAVRVAQFAHALQQAGTAGEVDLERTRNELAALETDLAAAALEDLLGLHLAAHAGGSSFAWWGRPKRTAQQAWSELERLRSSRAGLPGVPGPGEPALAVARRLLAALESCDLEPARSALWSARFLRAEHGPRVGCEAFRQHLAALEPGTVGPEVHAALLAGLVEACLDRGGVREARELLAAHPSLLELDRRLAQLKVWAEVAAGDLERARQHAAALDPWRGALPSALVDLRERWSEAAPLLSGTPAGRAAQLGEGEPIKSRTDLGASVLAVFAFGPGRSVEPLHLDVAPGLQGALEDWLLEREGSHTQPTMLEHELVLSARTCFASGAPLRGALGGTRTTPGCRSLACALEPVLDHEGEVAGWLHLECEHHLLPPRAELERLARAWRPAILRRGRFALARELEGADRVSESRPSVDGWNRVDAEARLSRRVPEREVPFLRGVFEPLARALGVETSRRRWWGFVVRGGQPSFVCAGGALEEGVRWGGARALERALATGGVVRFDESSEGLAIDARSCSGLVLPIRSGKECVGLLAAESLRRRDFRGAQRDEHQELASRCALSLELAGLRAWHHERHGHDLFFDLSSPGFRQFAREVRLAASSDSPVFLSGPPGAGKTVIARWLHFLRCGERAPLELLDVRAELVHGALAPRLSRLASVSDGGGLLVEGVTALPQAEQAELMRILEGRSGGGPGQRALFLTRELRDSDSDSSVDLRTDLSARLARLELHVPGLCDRREELAGWLRFLVGRFALEEGKPAPVLTDGVIATLWRQPWCGGLRELEGLAFKLVLLFAGREVGVSELEEAASRYRLELLRKLPSRRPRRVDLVAALRSTLKAGTNINKRRAAEYLGWDPDTLCTRLGEARLDQATLDAEPLAWQR
jgi:transcriptional regulator with AAA-type ATPase domain